MKKLLSFLLLGLFGLSLTGCGASVGYYKDADKYVVGNQDYDSSVTAIDVDWISGHLEVAMDYDVEGVSIYEETNAPSEKGRVHSYLNDGILRIKYAASGYHFPPFKSYSKNLKVLYNPAFLSLKDLSIDLTSGTLEAGEIKALQFSLEMTSGSANIQALACDSCDIDITSGDVTIAEADVYEFDADMTSGDMNVVFVRECNASFEMTSGSIYITLPENGGTVVVSKTSGRVITNRECTTSGNIYKFDDGNAYIRVSMTSGKLTIS